MKTLNPKSKTPHLKTLNPKPNTLNPKPLNPEPKKPEALKLRSPHSVESQERVLQVDRTERVEVIREARGLRV